MRRIPPHDEESGVPQRSVKALLSAEPEPLDGVKVIPIGVDQTFLRLLVDRDDIIRLEMLMPWASKVLESEFFQRLQMPQEVEDRLVASGLDEVEVLVHPCKGPADSARVVVCLRCQCDGLVLATLGSATDRFPVAHDLVA